MIAVIQRVIQAEVKVKDACIGKIGKGLLALVAVEKGDKQVQAERLAERLLSYRVFPDGEERMNLNVRDICGELLLVPQFTLAADTRKGTRPSFTPAAAPEEGQRLFELLAQKVEERYRPVECGRFGADMQVSLINDGPVTFILRVTPSE